MKKRIAFIGIGIMGLHMASHLIKKFGNINIIKRNSHKTKKFIAKYKKNYCIFVYDNLKELSENSDIIISCVGNDKDLSKIYLAKNAIFDNVKKKTVIIDHTTSSAIISQKLYKKFLQKDCFFFDAPGSGGEIGAINGKLAIMVGGNKKKFTLLSKIIEPYCKSLIYMGKSGNGQLTKMVNQICVASIIQGLAEGINFAKNKNLKIDNLINVVKNGAAQSWQLENRSKTMWQNKFNFGFMNKLMLKDLNLLINECKNSNIKLPMTTKIKEYYVELVKKGFSEEDTSNLIRLLR